MKMLLTLAVSLALTAATPVMAEETPATFDMSGMALDFSTIDEAVTSVDSTVAELDKIHTELVAMQADLAGLGSTIGEDMAFIARADAEYDEIMASLEQYLAEYEADCASEPEGCEDEADIDEADVMAVAAATKVSKRHAAKSKRRLRALKHRRARRR